MDLCGFCVVAFGLAYRGPRNGGSHPFDPFNALHEDTKFPGQELDRQSGRK